MSTQTLHAHLKERHFDVTDYSSVFVSEEHGKVYFYLYGFSGKMVGFQCYTPKQPKRAHHLEDEYRRYYTYLTKECSTVKKTAFGL